MKNRKIETILHQIGKLYSAQQPKKNKKHIPKTNINSKKIIRFFRILLHKENALLRRDGQWLDNYLSKFFPDKKSNSRYTNEWTITLRRSIRERDKYTCRLCGEQQGDKALSIHHIDYNKENCNPDNLISLCISCHSQTNGDREYWEKLLNNILLPTTPKRWR